MEPEPDWLGEDEEPIREFRALLPHELTVPAAALAHFFHDVSLNAHPLALEIIGDPNGVVFQFALHDDDAHLLGTQLDGHFPEITFQVVEPFLEDVWQDAEEMESMVIEFGLRGAFMLPLENCEKADPFVGMIAAMGAFRENEAAIYQVIFTPLSAPWEEHAIAAVTREDGKPFFDDGADMLKATKEKISSPLYGVVVRLAAKGPDLDGVWEHIRSMAASLRVFSRQGGNSLIPLRNDDYEPVQHSRDLIRRKSRRTGMILNLHELIGFVHFPSAAVTSPRLLRDMQNTRAAKLDDQNDGICLGHNEHLGENQEVRLTNEQRVRHMHILGASGSGKSTLLFNLLLQDIENGAGLALLDPHGDLVDRVLGVIPEWRIDDVVLLDPSDEQFIVPFNFLQAHSDFEKTLLASDLVAIFRAQSTSWGDQMNSVFGNAIRAFLESTKGGTLADVRRFLLDAEWREKFLQTVTDPDVIFYWKRGFPQLGGNKSIGPILTRLETFLSPKPIRYMVSQRENQIDFAEIMDSGKIFLAKLPQGQMGKENSYLLGSLLIAKLQQMAMSRQRMESGKRRPFFVYADEFQNFICPSMAEILSGARKYGMGLILAHQDLRQLERDKEVANAVLSNAFTRVVFRVGDSDARSLAEGFAHFEARDLQNLEIGGAICRIERADNDFNLSVPLMATPAEWDASTRREEVIEQSRASYATPRAEVEAALHSDIEDADKPKTKPRQKVQGANEARASEKSAEDTEQATAKQSEAKQSKANPADEQPEAPPTFPQVVPDSPAAEEPLTPPTGRHSSQDTTEHVKGGHQHRIVQERLQQAGFDRGFRVMLEMSVGDGKETVDVGLIRDDLRIACEVSVTTTVDHEMGNARKCLKAGFNFVLLITAEDGRRTQMIKAVNGHFPPENRSRIRCMSPDESVEFIRNRLSNPQSPPRAFGRGRLKVSDEHVEAIATRGPVAGDYQAAGDRRVECCRVLPAGRTGGVHFSLVAPAAQLSG